MDASTWSATTAWAVATILAIWDGWNWTMRTRADKEAQEAKEIAENRRNERKEERKKLLEGAYILRKKSDRWKRTNGHGEIALVFVGTYAARLAPYILEAFIRAGAAETIGCIYLVEFDKTEFDLCYRKIPDEFRSRVISASCPNLPIGGVGDTIEKVEARKTSWADDLGRSTVHWIHYLERETEHGLLLMYQSPGGMTAFGKAVLQTYRKRYRDVPVYMTTILDHKQIVRQRFPQARAVLAQEGVVNGAIITDNLRSPERADLGIAALFASMVSGGWVGTLPTQMWNGLSYLFAPETGVRYATISVWAETLPVYHLDADEAGEEVFYTKRTLIKDKAIRGIKAVVLEPQLQSVPLEQSALGQTRLLYVIVPIIPEPDLEMIAMEVDANLKEWREATDINLLINYASIGNELQPDTQQTSIIVVLLQPLADDGTQIDELALGVHQIDPKFLGQSQAPTPPALPNGGLPARRGRPPRNEN